MTDREEPLLSFPTAYPIKVVCRQQRELRLALDAIVRRHAPELTETMIHERDSSAGNFISITYAITARSAEHVGALVAELRAHPAVVMLL